MIVWAQRAWRALDTVTRRLEALPAGPGAVVAAVAGIIAVRSVLEIAVVDNPVYPGLALLVQYPLAYVAPFAALTLVLAFFAQVAPARVARLMVLAWLITLLPPLADLLLHAGRARMPAIGYLHAEPSDLAWIFLHFFDPSVPLTGTTAGIRVEALCAVLLGALYVFLRRRSLLRAAGAAVTIYGVSLFFFALPVLVLALFRWQRPGMTWDDFYRGEGILVRLDAAEGAHAVPILWLVPLLGLIFAGWRALERRSPDESWLPPEDPPPLLRGTGWFAALAAVCGLVAARWLYLPPGPLAARAAWDTLAGAGGPLAVGLAAFALAPAHRAVTAARVLALAGALALAAALGAPFTLGLAAAAAPLLLLRTEILPRRALAPAAAAATALAGCGAFLAGWNLLIGPHGVARLPLAPLGPIAGAGLLAGVLTLRGTAPAPLAGALAGGAALAAGALLLGAPALLLAAVPIGIAAGWAGALIARSRFSRRWAALLAGLAALLVTQGGTAADAVRAPLAERVRCVARLEELAGREALANGNVALAKAKFNRALECDAAFIPALDGLAQAFLAEQRPDVALRKYKKILKIDPDSPNALNNVAATLLVLNRADEALEFAERARARAPRDPSALFNRARALNALGRTGEALDAWREYVRIAGPRPEEKETVDLARKRIRELRRALAADTEKP